MEVYFSQLWRLGGPRSKCQSIWFQWNFSSWLANDCFSLCPHMTERALVSLPLLTRALIPVQPPLPYILLSLFSGSVMTNSLQPHGLQHVRLPCPSLSPRVCSNSSPLSWWCHPTISSSVVPFSSCPQSFPASGHQGLFQWVSSSHQMFRKSIFSKIK